MLRYLVHFRVALVKLFKASLNQAVSSKNRNIQPQKSWTSKIWKLPLIFLLHFLVRFKFSIETWAKNYYRAFFIQFDWQTLCSHYQTLFCVFKLASNEYNYGLQCTHILKGVQSKKRIEVESINGIWHFVMFFFLCF